MRRLFFYSFIVAAMAATIITPVKAVEKTDTNTHTLSEIAAANGLDAKQFTQCVKDKKYAEKIATDEAEGYKLGAQGTPYTIVLGPRGEKIAIAGAYPLAAWQDLFESLLGISPTPKPGDGTLPTATNVSSTIAVIDTVKEGVWGNPTGTLSLIIYTDFDCPFCKRLHETMLELSKKFPNDLRWVNRNLPLDVLHRNARLKANAAECAQEQNKYFGFVNDIFVYQNTTNVSEFGGTTVTPEVKPNLPDTFYVRDIYNATDNPTEAKDQELVQIHGNGDNDTHTVIIASLRKLFPELKKYNLSLTDFASPKVQAGANYVIFRAKQDNSDKQPRERFYRFDIKKQELKAMKINQLYQGGKGSVTVSPSADRFLWIPTAKNHSARQLYVFDLLADTRKLLVSLPASQTFDAGDPKSTENFIEVEWLSNNKVGYTVFSQTKKPSVDIDDKDWREKLLVRSEILELEESPLYFDYSIRNLPTEGDAPIDQQLIAVSKEYGTTDDIVIPSIKKLFPSLPKNNLTLKEFAAPDNSLWSFYRATNGDYESQPLERFYKFNADTKKLSSMKINSLYRGSTGAVILSPDQTKFLWLPERGKGVAQTMYLADLTADSMKKIVQLRGNETFEKFSGEMLNFAVGVEWINDTTISYQVFDQKKKQTLYNDPEAPKIYQISTRQRKI